MTEVFPRRCEYLDLLCGFNNLDAMLHVGRDGVGVAGAQFMLRVAREDANATGKQVAALLVRMRVKRDDVVYTVAHLRDH